ncbi:caspase family protein [Nostoc piscinale]|uniref:caspase family protein n=1 Tax=Nostoc piscinale TaxID=224012 RepID=UPI00078170DC|nr:caspase family protein [Nostoc piscinale]
MAKVALLIGNSEYMYNLSPLPCATNDVEAMQRVLQNSEIGGFDQVEQLLNPDLQEIQVKIKTLFAGRKKRRLGTIIFFLDMD